MSREELVVAYLDGQISRRVFVRRLMAVGVSLGAALAYSEMNAAQAHANDSGDHYDHYGEGKDKKPKKPKKPKKDKKDKGRHKP
jgi:hypothetical protein